MSLEAYIRQAAAARGIDPDIAVRVASGEGGLANPFRHGEGPAPRSQDPRFGRLENSFGPFQLYISGNGAGLGDRAVAAGVDPRTNWQGGIDFALDEAKRKGWGQWYGAKAKGVTGMMGIGNAPSPLSPEAAQFVQNNPQPGGYGSAVEGQTGGGLGGGIEGSAPKYEAPGLAPFGGSGGILADVPSDVAAYAASDEKSPLQKFFAKLADTPDAPPVRFQQMGDARQTGNSLLKQLQATPISDILLKQRLLG
ncbi:hypothetical protein [Mesorhizobium sp. M4B.F.Ca.ET.143.01.1.1]|uniref:hypothetical protein n=1 Tax=Mesorhizobium sp. M4B.F.Ca.ET.143.01.1.1 TaxID=2563947 RepID=UPI0010936E74|nr:hypothetical protein [Mesorhizobium sp. M4B.F.Ca.ET.143.01.1.1]TGV26331.1 hypothetical protein EN786_12460 [Mesorhizobium sp. M4B.F.Ca.ET.143.01.1.1]